MRKFMNRKKEGGFSLVEIAIVLVIIGLIVSAIAVGRTTMRKGEAMKAWQAFMNPWIQSALNTWANSGTAGWGTVPGLEDTFEISGGNIELTTIPVESAGNYTITFVTPAMDNEACLEFNAVVGSALSNAASITLPTVGNDGCAAGTVVVVYEVPGVNISNDTTA